MMKQKKREPYQKYLDWCIVKFDINEKMGYPPALKISQANSEFCGEFFEEDCSITIFDKNIEDTRTAIKTVIHEYRHYLMAPDEGSDIHEVLMRFLGGVNFITKISYCLDPCEVDAKKFELKYWKECYRDVVEQK